MSTIPAIPPWFAPLAVVIAWLAHLFEQSAKLKRLHRTTKFKPSWRDHWPKLRQCEWRRHQILAASAAQPLAGQEIDLSDFIRSTEPPEHYVAPPPCHTVRDEPRRSGVRALAR